MNKVYTSVTSCLASIKDFLVSAGYTIDTDISSNWRGSVFVVDTLDSKYKLIFYDYENRLYVTIAKSFDNSIYFYKQDLTIRANKLGSGQYATMEIESFEGDLYCNSNGNSLMFAKIETSTVARMTQFVFIGDLVRKFNEIESGIFIGGTQMALHVDKTTTDVDVFEDNRFALRNKRAVFIALLSEIDDAPIKERDNTIWATNFDISTLNLVCSLTMKNRGADLPTYGNFNSTALNLTTMDFNTANAITLCLPLMFFVIRDPQILDTYSLVGTNDIITYVDMFNMSSGRMIDSSYPVKKENYQCFSIYTRRNVEGMLGYVGVAFKQEE